VGDFKDLRVWRLAHSVTIEVYRLTQKFPSDELFGLTSQLRRAAASVSANIAESRGRRTIRDQQRFLDIAQGSARELECHLLLARDLELISAASAAAALAEVETIQRMLSGLIGTRS
jgi:four helix bundle protein